MLPLIARRSTCDRARVGCLIVSPDNRILMSGYNGSPAGMPHCGDVGHLYEKTIQGHTHCIRTIHAEMNALLYCARNGISVGGATMYVSIVPCFRCTYAIVQAGIHKVVAVKLYHRMAETLECFEQSGVKLEVLNEVL